MSHSDSSLFASQVYLLSTDVSLYAADHAECLKSLQGLVQQLLPTLVAQAAQRDQVTTEPAEATAQQVRHTTLYVCHL